MKDAIQVSSAVVDLSRKWGTEPREEEGIPFHLVLPE